MSSFKKTVQYDPAKSETFKALREAELGDEVREVTVPVQPRVFSPVKNAQAKVRIKTNTFIYISTIYFLNYIHINRASIFSLNPLPRPIQKADFSIDRSLRP